MWVYAGLWRLHSGGGGLLVGAVDAAGRARQLRAEALQRAEALEREASTRVLEQLVLEGEAEQVDQEAERSIDR